MAGYDKGSQSPPSRWEEGDDEGEKFIKKCYN